MEDVGIVRLLWERSEQAVAELEAKYGRAALAMSRNIVGNTEDAAECVNDTWLGVWNAVPPRKPERLGAFVLRICRNLSLKRRRYNTADRRSAAGDLPFDELEECLPAPSAEEAWQAKQVGQAIDRFLDGLEADNRRIFVRRYWFCDSVREIAALTGMSENRISVRLSRMRGRLKIWLAEEGIEG